jgi:dTDP-4-amino-4,6-dideoxygalactose transaminase
MAERASKEVLSLPIYPELREAQIELVVNEIKNFFS